MRPEWDKHILLQKIQAELEILHQLAVDAAMRAYKTATHKENIAENKYDTLGLEASYLAQGQAARVDEYTADLQAYKALTLSSFGDDDPVALSALVWLSDNQDVDHFIFIAPAAGGLKIRHNDQDIVVVTPQAPLGKLLLGRYVGDEVELQIGHNITGYEIRAIY